MSTDESLFEGPEWHTVPGTCQIIIKDAVVLFQDGKEIVRLDARYDFEGIDPAYHAMLLTLIGRAGRVRLGMLSQQDEQELVERQNRFREKLAKYEALPWWRKIFTGRRVALR